MQFAIGLSFYDYPGIAHTEEVFNMIGQDGKPMSKEMIRAAVKIYAEESRGSKAFAGLPRALVSILDALVVGKTTYVKAQDGQLQLTRKKDKTLAVT